MNIKKKIILVSASPRRKQILEDAGFVIEIRPTHADESFSSTTPVREVPVILAKRKAAAAPQGEEITIAADTVVLLQEEILNKPENPAEAATMLRKLSGTTHEVITAVCIREGENYHTFSDTAKVTFRKLEEVEIQHYIAQYKPFDKAGAYGVQDFIGMVGIPRIEGSFYTVMGLPVHLIYEHLKKYISW
jgi:septum formation protein